MSDVYLLYGYALSDTSQRKEGKTMKGIKLDGLFRVIRRGSSCVGCMAWETPYIIFSSLETGQEYKWHSEVIEVAERIVPLYEGRVIAVQAFAYDDRLRRVRLSDSYNSFRGESWHRKHTSTRLMGLSATNLY